MKRQEKIKASKGVDVLAFVLFFFIFLNLVSGCLE